MLFGKKLNRAQKWLREQNPDMEAVQDDIPDDLPSMEDLKAESRELNLDKSDMLAMILSAMITIIPVCVVTLLVLVGIVYFIFF